MKKQHLKDYQAARGLQLDGSFEYHVSVCDRCRKFDPAKPATAGAMCLEGAVLWKRDNAARPRSTPPERDEHRGTKAQVKALTRYRGE